MQQPMLKLSADDVQRVVSETVVSAECEACSSLICRGWESFPGSVSEATLQRIGSRWLPSEDEPTLEEFHTEGTNYWSPRAPIALEFHPYNRSELWACTNCRRLFLRYTEYGGYYEDRRIRELDPALLVVDRPAA
jgi:hypothetical protein